MFQRVCYCSTPRCALWAAHYIKFVTIGRVHCQLTAATDCGVTPYILPMRAKVTTAHNSILNAVTGFERSVYSTGVENGGISLYSLKRRNAVAVECLDPLPCGWCGCLTKRERVC